MPQHQRLAHHPRTGRSATGDLGVPQEAPLLRHDHSQGVRWTAILRAGAFGGAAEAQQHLLHRRLDRRRAQLAGSGRADPALRHAGPEGLLPAAPRRRPRDPLLRPHRSLRRLGRHVDSGLRHRVQGRVERRAGARRAPHLRQALHHPGPGGQRRRPGLPPARPRPSALRRGGPRHYPRPDSTRDQGPGDRPPPHAAQRALPERPGARQGRVRAAVAAHRRRGHGGPRLAHAGGVPLRRTRHLAAVQCRRRLAHGGGRDWRVCAHPQAVRHGHRPLRGRRRGPGAHRRPRLRHHRALACHRRRGGPRREAGCTVGHRQVPRHGTRPRHRPRRDGRTRRQGGHSGSQELPWPRLAGGAHRHHGGRRQHHDAQPDDLRPGRHPLPPLRAQGDAGRADARCRRQPARLRPRPVRPYRLRHFQCRAQPVLRPHPRAAGLRPGRPQHAPLLPQAQPLRRGAGPGGRHLDAGTGRQAEVQGEALRSPRRRAVQPVHRQRHAQALRGPGAPER